MRSRTLDLNLARALSYTLAFAMQLKLFTSFGVLALVASLPIPEPEDATLEARQSLLGPGANITDLGLGEGLSNFEPIGEATWEGDSDSGGEDKGSGDANSVANGYVPGSGIGSTSSSFNGNGSTSGSSACCKFNPHLSTMLTGSALLECTSETSAQNANGTSSETSSSGIGNVPLVQNSAPLVQLGGGR